MATLNDGQQFSAILGSGGDLTYVAAIKIAPLSPPQAARRDDDRTISAGAIITETRPARAAEAADLTGSGIVLAADERRIFGDAAVIPDIISVVSGIKVVLTARREGHIVQIPVLVDRRPAKLALNEEDKYADTRRGRRQGRCWVRCERPARSGPYGRARR
jgi:hypothetical protein